MHLWIAERPYAKMPTVIEDDKNHYRPFLEFSKWHRAEIATAAYDRYSGLLADRRKVASPEALRGAVNTATRVAAVDTGAIEGLYQVDRGFTRTVAIEAAAWEAAVGARGTRVRDAIEDALAAYDTILDLATKRVPVTEAFIRHIHATICATQENYTVYTPQGSQEQSLPKGEYKHYPNNPTSLTTGRVHHYAPVVDTPSEMQRLVTELSSVEFSEAHSVLQAAYAHYAFVSVHPFADGNGRVARALASVYLYRSPGVPLVIFADQKDAYIDALESADDGDSSLFVRFIMDRVIDGVQLVLSYVPEIEVPDLSATLASFRQAQLGRGGLSHSELDALQARILEAIEGELRSAVTTLGDLKPQLGWGHGRNSAIATPEGYRPHGGTQRHLIYGIESGPPADVKGDTIVSIFKALPSTQGADFLIVNRAKGVTPIEVYIRDVHPTLSQVFQFKIAAWVERLISFLAHGVVLAATAKLRKQGYID